MLSCPFLAPKTGEGSSLAWWIDRRPGRGAWIGAILLALPLASAPAQAPSLESRLALLETEFQRLRDEQAEAKRAAAAKEEEMQVVLEELDSLRAARATEGAPAIDGALEDREPVQSARGDGAWTRKLTLAGYGETHLNMVEGPGRDFIDNHRYVAYLGYEFAEWLHLHSEVEIEHSFVEDDDGLVALEQLYTDFLLSEALNFRVGRVLAPLGIINQRHEPTTFNGVERPMVDNVLIPTTWSLDGAGIFGKPFTGVSYEAYVSGSLDGSAFSSTSGIRGGRLKESPGVSDPALSGRIDIRPMEILQADNVGELRLGASVFYGGLDNGNNGVNPGVNGELTIVSGDAEYTFGDFDFRSVLVIENIDSAGTFNEIYGDNIASWLAGYYVEAAYHFWPDAWKQGKLADSDALAFIRFEDYNTQYQLPPGTMKDRRGDREDLVFGFSFFPTSQYVIKADMKIKDDDTSRDLPLEWNLGVGWIF